MYMRARCRNPQHKAIAKLCIRWFSQPAASHVRTAILETFKKRILAQQNVQTYFPPKKRTTWQLCISMPEDRFSQIKTSTTNSLFVKNLSVAVWHLHSRRQILSNKDLHYKLTVRKELVCGSLASPFQKTDSLK